MTKVEFALPRYPLPGNAALIDRKPHALDGAVLGEIVRHYRESIHAMAWAILGDFHAAEDVTQETFIVAFEKGGNLREPQALGCWLRRVAVSRCNRLMRRRRRLPMASLEMAGSAESHEPNPAEVLQQRERAVALLEAVRSLPEQHREAVVCFHMHDLSQREIARYCNVPRTTVKKRLHDARMKLRKNLAIDGV